MGLSGGRGALDDKVSLMGIMEAVEALLAQGFTPRRTVYLAFGHDEEVRGIRGAHANGRPSQVQGGQSGIHPG